LSFYTRQELTYGSVILAKLIYQCSGKTILSYDHPDRSNCKDLKFRMQVLKFFVLWIFLWYCLSNGKKCMFHSLIPLKNVQIIKGNVKCKTFFTLMYVQKKYYFLMTFFRHVLTILAWIKCRLVSKHVLSSTHFHSCFFLTFPVKFYIYKIFKSSIKEYLVLAILFLFYKYQLEQFRKWHEVRIKL